MNSSTVERLLNHKLLTKEEEETLAQRIAAGDEPAVHELVRSNVRFAYTLAKEWQGTRYPAGNTPVLDDLFSDAIGALYVAAKKFDPAKGRFVDLARTIIKDALLIQRNKALYGKQRSARSEDVNLARQTALKFSEETGVEPDAATLAELLGWSAERTAMALRQRRTVSLDAPVGSDGRQILADLLPDENAAGADQVAEKDDRALRLQAALQELKPRARQIIKMRFGFGPGFEKHPCVSRVIGRPADETSLRALGVCFGLSAGRVRQIEYSAMRKLRRLMTREVAPGPHIWPTSASTRWTNSTRSSP